MPNAIGAGISALIAARTAISTIGHNLANATTPGYTRERVLLETLGGGFSAGFSLGGGVRIGSIDRVTDDLLATRVRLQQHEVARQTTTLQHLIELQDVFGEPGPGGLSALLGGFFDSLAGLATAPDDSALRGGVVDAGASLAERFRRVRSEIGGTMDGIAGQISSAAREINTLSASLVDINRQLTLAQGSGRTPPELLDKQTQLVDRLAEMVDVNVQSLGFGRISVNIGGQMIVSGDRALPLEVEEDANGTPFVQLKDGLAPLDVSSGRLKGLLDLAEDGVGDKQVRLDDLARALIRDVNRSHATGVPEGGGHLNLRATNALVDRNGNGSFLDERLDRTGLPFDISSGALVVSIVDEATGSVTPTRIDVHANTGTVNDLLTALNGVNGLNATVDATGRLVLSASQGKRFHFAPALPSDPDPAGVFGSASATIAGSMAAPYALTSGDQLDLSVDGGAPQTVTFNAAAFADITQATAAEVAAAINAQVVGASASVVDGRVVIASSTVGTASSLQASDLTGSPLAALSLPSALDQGGAQPVSAALGGSYTGTSDQTFTIRPTGDGEVGITPGLQVEVLDSSGQVVATLDVGQGYAAGDDIDVVSGITVSFGPGSLSASAQDSITFAATAETDSTDVLVAFGLGAFFVGSDASSIDVNDAIAADSRLLAAGLGSAASDNRNILKLLSLREGEIEALGDRSIETYYSDLISNVGADVARSELAFETETLLLDSYKNRLEQVRGVSIDEELADLQRFEQSYAAAARFITAVNEVNQILLQI